ncbi:MAG: hypothetical protein KAS02_01205 [Candidatus Pacebacteria bacterium]|nr:hypothetical protein [Candidatus Paceibacterota bacterium]
MIETFANIFPPAYYSLIVGALNYLYLFMPIWLPVILIYILWNNWMNYIQTKFLNEQDYRLLELKLPNEIKKTPLAMELFLTSLIQVGGEANWYQKYVEGKSRPVFSLEMVSLEGQVKFFIWTRGFFKNLVEAQIYAQYPDIEITEVPDYTSFVNYDPNALTLWGTEFKLAKDDFYPIKTYVDYDMESKGIKEEEKIDPITPIIEYLGSAGKGQQIWLQILVKAHKKERKKALAWKEKWEKKEWNTFEDWGDQSKEAVKDLITEATKPAEEGTAPRMMTKGESGVIAAIERSVSKLSFDCNIRGIYLAEKESFNPINIVAMIGTFKQFNSNNLNGFKLTQATGFDFPWQDYKGIRVNRLKQKVFNEYRRRSFSLFYQPFVLNTEELATIYHFPGGVVQTPTLSKLMSKKAEAPFNLPT